MLVLIDENVISGVIYSLEINNIYTYSEYRKIVTRGVENLFIIDTSDTILIADESKSQQVKKDN